MYRNVLTAAMAAGALGVTACAEPAPVTAPSAPTSSPSLSLSAPSEQPSYIIDFTGNSLPADLATLVQAAGGSLRTSLDAIGVAVATSGDPDFPKRAARIRGVHDVAPDVMVQWIEPHQTVLSVEAESPAPPVAAALFGSLETFRLVQWAPDAVSAPDAWDAGARGAGARVAILDGGIRDTHIDIAPNLDVARSRSFVPLDSPAVGLQPFNVDIDFNPMTKQCEQLGFWHGTHVAGIVGAPGNNVGTVGIAPEATLIGVKVLHCDRGLFSWIIQGIVYAATPIAQGGAGAHIINMSLGAAFQRQGPGAAALAGAIGKATTYAYQQGVTVIAALGNEAFDLDHTNNLVFFPAMAPHVIAVSATGPLGWALGATNWDRPASYTNFGQSAVDFAGPGGDFVLPGTAVCSLPLIPMGTVTAPCLVFDLVVAPCRGPGASNNSYCSSAGTSMAAPAVAGVAALIIGRFGAIHPAHVEARLRASADDLGKPGNDDFYGGGRVNALRAVSAPAPPPAQP